MCKDAWCFGPSDWGPNAARVLMGIAPARTPSIRTRPISMIAGLFLCGLASLDHMPRILADRRRSEFVRGEGS